MSASHPQARKRRKLRSEKKGDVRVTFLTGSALGCSLCEGALIGGVLVAGEEEEKRGCWWIGN
jgi:hypothetical protein